MAAPPPALIEQYLDHITDLIDGLPVKRAASEARIWGPQGVLTLRGVPGGYIELSADLALQLGSWPGLDDEPELGLEDMEWWAELSDAACAWEQLGFELDQPGAFAMCEGPIWMYCSIARKRLRVSRNGRRVLEQALRLPQTLLA